MAIDPKLVSIVKAENLPSGEPTAAGEFLFYEGDALQKSSMSNIYDQVKSGITGEATQANAPGSVGFERWVVSTPLTLPNSWGFAVTPEELETNDVYFNVTDGVVSKDSQEKRMPTLSSVLDPLSTTEATTGKSVSDFVVDDVLGFKRISLNPTITDGSYGYVGTSLTMPKSIVVASNSGTSLVEIENRFNDGDLIEITFNSLYYPSEPKRIVFLSGNRILEVQTLTEDAVDSKVFLRRVPLGTDTVVFNTLIADRDSVTVNQLTTTEPKKYDYFYGQNVATSWESGVYLNASGNLITSSSNVYTSSFLPIYSEKIMMYGVNLQPASAIIFYDENRNFISSILREDSQIVHNPIPGNPDYWDLLTIITPPPSAVFFRVSHNRSYYSKINNTITYTINIDKTYVYFNENFNFLPDIGLKNINSNIKSQRNIPLLPVSKITNGNKVLTLENKAEKGVGRIAFRFKFLENVNLETSEKKLVEIISKDGNDYFNFVVNKDVTSLLSDKDHPLATINTTYPIPMFNSSFGVRTNLTSVLEARRNINYPKRGIKGISDTTIGKNSKPLSGEPLFYLRFISGDVSSPVDQGIMNTWSDLTFAISNSSLSLTSATNSYYITSDFVDFNDMVELYLDFKSKINNSILAGKIDVVSINLNSRQTYFPNPDYANFKMFNLPSDLVPMSVPLISDYYNAKLGVMIKDSFPAYAFKGIDESWHTFEFVLPIDMDAACFTIDGHFFQYDSNFSFNGVKKVFDKGGTIKIGGEINIDVKDLVVEFDEYSDAEVRDYNPLSHRLISSYHPQILHVFGHDLYYCEDKGVPFSDIGLYKQYVSEGGFIPDELKNPNPNYAGDDSLMPIRKNLADPSFHLEQYLAWVQKAGFVHVNNKDIAEFHRCGKPLPKRSFLLGMDDIPTYIFKKQELRSIFTRYGYRPYFALELGYYADSSVVTDFNIALRISNLGDTDEHRLELQKRVRLMQDMDWGIVLHGRDVGFVHQGSSYNEMINEIKVATDMAIQMGFDISYWCIAANMYTPNSIYLHDISGIATSSSVEMGGSALFQHPNYIGRTGWTSTNYSRKGNIF